MHVVSIEILVSNDQKPEKKSQTKCVVFSYGKIYRKAPQNIMIYVVQVFFAPLSFISNIFMGV
jgi:hypothetical protein